MPANKTITREKILQAAIAVLRRSGEESVNTLSVAKELNCSTQPIYLSFENIDSLRLAMRKEAEKEYLDFLEGELADESYPPYKAYGRGYIRFAMREKKLFRFLFLSDRQGRAKPDESWDISVRMIREKLGISQAQAEKFHFEQWIFVHGIAAMCATGFRDFSEEEIDELLSDSFFGFQSRIKE